MEAVNSEIYVEWKMRKAVAVLMDGGRVQIDI